MRIVTLALLLVPAAGLAQDVDGSAETGRKVRYADRTEIDFTVLEVDAPLVRPMGINLTERLPADWPPMFELRTHFNVEMNESVDQVK